MRGGRLLHRGRPHAGDRTRAQWRCSQLRSGAADATHPRLVVRRLEAVTPVCGRFTLTYRERERLARELGGPIDEIPEEEYRARYNVAPTDSHWIVRLRGEEREARPAKWGL